MNKVILTGSLGRDPEVRSTNTGTMVAKLNVATSDRYKDKDGQWQDRTDWHTVVAWGNTAKAAGDFLKKGSKVAVEGKIQTRSYEKDGQKRYSTEIIADKLEFLSSKGDAAESRPMREPGDEDIDF